MSSSPLSDRCICSSRTAGGASSFRRGPNVFLSTRPLPPSPPCQLNLSSMCLLSQARLSDMLPGRAQLHRDLPEGRHCVRLTCVGQKDVSQHDLCYCCVCLCLLVPGGPQVFELCCCRTFGSWNRETHHQATRGPPPALVLWTPELTLVTCLR